MTLRSKASTMSLTNNARSPSGNHSRMSGGNNNRWSCEYGRNRLVMFHTLLAHALLTQHFHSDRLLDLRVRRVAPAGTPAAVLIHSARRLDMTRGSFATLIVLVVALLTIVAGSSTAETLVVAQDGHGSAKDCNASTPTPYTTIASAVAATRPRDVIKICPGTYPEQITIAKSLTLRGESGAVVQPPAMVANTTSLVTGNALATIIVVDGV